MLDRREPIEHYTKERTGYVYGIRVSYSAQEHRTTDWLLEGPTTLPTESITNKDLDGR